MDAVIKKLHEHDDLVADSRPSQAEVEAAVRTLIRWAGDNPEREGLQDTPKRVAKAYKELFGGYDEDPEEILGRTFEEVAGYKDMVLVKDITFFSHCEHHMVPITGKAHIAYYPNGGVVGLSKLARVVEIFGRRLQTQETMTAQITRVIEDVLKPHGLAVLIEAEHMCMTMRGVRKHGASTTTTSFTGRFADNPHEQSYFLSLVKARS